MARFLIDKSVLARMRSQSVVERVRPIIESGDAVSCAIIDLEVLYSARSHEDLLETARRRRLAYDDVPLTPSVFDRALHIQQRLAAHGKHRLPIPDLIIAAAAIEHGLTVLHYDADFELIAEVTDQPTEWVVPRGSVD